MEVTIKNIKNEEIFVGNLEVVPAVGDTITFSDSRYYSVRTRALHIDLKGIKPTTVEITVL
jgi:hypothetical protein